MKGQFFTLGAFVLIGMLSIGLVTQRPVFSPPSVGMACLSSNIMNEFPRALNFGMESGAPAETLVNFSVFLNQTMEERHTNFTALWVVGEGNGSDIVNMTVGNFFDSPLNVSLNVSGTCKTLYVGPGSVNSTLFDPVQPRFGLTIGYSGRTSYLEWQRDKVNLFVFSGLERTGSIIRKEWSS